MPGTKVQIPLAYPSSESLRLSVSPRLSPLLTDYLAQPSLLPGTQQGLSHTSHSVCSSP